MSRILKTFILAGTVSTIALTMAGHQADAAEASATALPPLAKGAAGKYLSSLHAQTHHDWTQANKYLGDIINSDPENAELVRRSMILSLGAGDIDTAAERAQQLIALKTGDDSLALMVTAVHDMANDHMDDAIEHLDSMPPGDMTDFIKPILKSWALASQGTLSTEGFNETAIHNYHGALLATFLNDKEAMRKYTDAMLELGTLSGTDAERAADMLVLTDRKEEAAALYEQAFIHNPENEKLAEKLQAIKDNNDDKLRSLTEPLQIKSANQGSARAMYEMAFILYQEYSDSSTKLFANMALALDENLTEAHLLMADTLSRNGRLNDAIEQLNNVPESHPSYMIVQRHIADLLAEAGRHDDARKQLSDLFTKYNDVESLIRLGDLYRQEENYESALNIYNQAANHIGKDIPEEYWYLLYARGMAYEREGDWLKAESDLKAALGFRPDHPHLLNYLGYGWADQGVNLEESMELIKRAAAIRPRDGYIIDSLGWVNYMMGNYKEALPHLERAVELLPYDSTINDHLGDVYWLTGRKTEARFQWERALNYNEGDAVLSEKLEKKLRFGLEGADQIRKAGVE